MSIACPQEDQSVQRPIRARTKPVSEARLRANRLNAQKSTGPRTKEGKSKSAHNAHRHGLCSESPLLPGESEATYQIFQSELEEELQPRSIFQKTLFPEIARLTWKLRRFADAERELFATEATSPDQLPCSVLAQAFHQNPTANPFLLFNRYELSLRNALLRQLRMYYYLKKHHPTTPHDPDEPPCPEERAWPYPLPNEPIPTHLEQDKTPATASEPHPTPSNPPLPISERTQTPGTQTPLPPTAPASCLPVLVANPSPSPDCKSVIANREYSNRTSEPLMRAIAFLATLLSFAPLFTRAAAPKPAPKPATKPATTRTSADKPPRQLSDAELQKALDRIIEESDGENRRHQRQMDMINKVKRDAVSIHDRDAIEHGNQMLDDEKHRHADRQKYLSDRYTEIQSELDARHPKPPK